MAVETVAAIAGLVLQGIGLVTDISGNETRNRRLRELGLREAEAEREAGRIAARDFRESADRLRYQAGQTREQAGEFAQQGAMVRSQQSLAFTRGGVRLSGSALDRLSETTRKITRGTDRIIAYANEQDVGAERLDRAAGDARQIAQLRAQNAMRGARAGQRSTLAVGLRGLAGMAQTAAGIDWGSLGSGSPSPAAAGGSGPMGGAPNYNTMDKRALLQWG